jgi:hypothetical protein
MRIVPISLQGAGGLFLHAADESKFVRALMHPALLASDGKVLITAEQMKAFIASKGDNVAIGTGSLGFKERTHSVRVEKGGSIDEYHHQFQCERPKDPSKINETIGIVMSNNFLVRDQGFEKKYMEFYEEAVAILFGKEEEEKITFPDATPSSSVEGKISDAKLFFKGTRGLFAYKPGEFLNWSGTPFPILKSEGDPPREYIFHKGEYLVVKLYEKGDFNYLGLGDGFIASQIKKDKILEAGDSTDLTGAKEVFRHLEGV